MIFCLQFHPSLLDTSDTPESMQSTQQTTLGILSQILLHLQERKVKFKKHHREVLYLNMRQSFPSQECGK